MSAVRGAGSAIAQQAHGQVVVQAVEVERRDTEPVVDVRRQHVSVRDAAESPEQAPHLAVLPLQDACGAQ